MKRRILSLFAGVGGLERGLELAGLGEVVEQVEIDPFCRAVLRTHWPKVIQHEDVKLVGSVGAPLRACDVICGGFPCQQVSSAGKGEGLGTVDAPTARSGLWYEYLRIVGELRPRLVIVENVASGKAKWLCQVRSDLQALGYRTRAFALSAADVGAPHLRRRIFVLAHTDRPGLEGTDGENTAGSLSARSGGGDVADADARRSGPGGELAARGERAGRPELAGSREAVADARTYRRGGGGGEAHNDHGEDALRHELDGCDPALPDPDRGPVRIGAERVPGGWPGELPGSGGAQLGHDRRQGGRGAESRLGRDAPGLPGGMDGRGDPGLPAEEIPGEEAFTWPAGRGQEQHAWEPPRVTERGQRNRRKRLAAIGNSVNVACGYAIGRLALSLLEGDAT